MKGKPIAKPGYAIAVAQMLSSDRWLDGPGGERDPDIALEDRLERDRMEREFDKIWRGEE